MFSAPDGWLVLSVALCTGACGPTVPRGGVPNQAQASSRAPKAIESIDAIPADLDLVMRLDIAKVTESLGEASARELVNRALEEAGSRGTVRRALASAEVVWLGVRVADLEAGDRVLVVHSKEKAARPEGRSWQADGKGAWARWASRHAVSRNEFEQVYRPDDHALVFVSPVEAPSVARVLRRGPDPQRGQPAARGLLSLDYRATRLSPELAQRFPSLARLLSGIERVQAIVDLRAGSLELDGRIRCKSQGAAERVHRFIDTVRRAGRQSHGELLEGLEVERSGSTVTVAWPLPRGVVARWLHPEPAADAETPATREAPP